jgi:Domain of unknown function (DUF4252)
MHLRTCRRVGPCLLLAATALLAACTGAPSPEEVRGEIERQLPGSRFQPAEHFRLGPVSMGLVHWLVGFDHDRKDEAGRAIVRAISHVEVATYKVLALPETADFRLSEKLERRLQGGGWTTLVRTEEKGEHAWVLYRVEAPATIRELYIVTLDPKELTLVHLRGRLDEVAARALAEKPRKVAQLVP